MTAAAFTEDGRWLVTTSGDNRWQNATNVAELRLWNMEKDGFESSSLLFEGNVGGAFECSDDSRWLVARTDDTTVRIWDLHADDPSRRRPMDIDRHAN